MKNAKITLFQRIDFQHIKHGLNEKLSSIIFGYTATIEYLCIRKCVKTPTVMKRIIYILLTLLGFGVVACEDKSDIVMYGSPICEYHLSARVVDDKGNPIAGIEVHETYGPEYPSYSNHIATTDQQGVIDLRNKEISYPRYIRLVDVDGEENGGEFEEQTLNITNRYKKVEEGEGWYTGSFEAELGDVTLKRVESNEEETIE